MRDIFNIFDEMIDCINKAFPEYRVSMGYRNVPSDRPVLETAVYITADEIRERELDFVIHVYTPLSLGGSECVRTACEIYNVLYDGGLELKNVVVGAAEYNSDSQGFAVKIRGTAEDDSLEFKESEPTPEPGSEKIRCTAVIENEDGPVEYNFLADSCKINCDEIYYPIMTVFESYPYELIDGVKSRKIVLGGIGLLMMRYLTAVKSFELSIDNGRETFENCYCEKYERNSDGEFTITMRTTCGQRPQEIREDSF